MTVSITEFISARLDDDEAYARNAFRPHGDGGPKNGPEWREIWSGTVECGLGGEHIATFDSQLSRHIERHDPARALREIAAKRAILDDHTTPHTTDGGFCVECGQLGPEGHKGDNWKAEDWCAWHGDNVCPTVRSLADAYSDHPDYNPGWSTT